MCRMEVDPNDANFASSNLSERTDVFAIEVPRDIDEELTDDGFANADVTQAKDAMAGRKVIKWLCEDTKSAVNLRASRRTARRLPSG